MYNQCLKESQKKGEKGKGRTGKRREVATIGQKRRRQGKYLEGELCLSHQTHH